MASLKVVLLQANVSPVFAEWDEATGRPGRVFGLPDGQPWVVGYADLSGLANRVEAFEAEATAGLAKAGEERNGEVDGGAAKEDAEQGVRTAGGARLSARE